MVAEGMLLRQQRHLGARFGPKRAVLHVAAYKQDQNTAHPSSKTSQQQVSACRLQQGRSNSLPVRPLHTAACRVAVQEQLEPNRVLKASLDSILRTYYGEACTSMHRPSTLPPTTTPACLTQQSAQPDVSLHLAAPFPPQSGRPQLPRSSSRCMSRAMAPTK